MSSVSQVLNVAVGESPRESGSRTAVTMKAIARGEKVMPHFGVNFEQIGQILTGFIPKRWKLIVTLRQADPLRVAELAITQSPNRFFDKP